MAVADADTAASAAPAADTTTANPSGSAATAHSAAGAQNNASSSTDTAIPDPCHCFDDGRLNSIAASSSSSSCFQRERRAKNIDSIKFRLAGLINGAVEGEKLCNSKQLERGEQSSVDGVDARGGCHTRNGVRAIKWNIYIYLSQ